MDHRWSNDRTNKGVAPSSRIVVEVCSSGYPRTFLLGGCPAVTYQSDCLDDRLRGPKIAALYRASLNAVHSGPCSASCCADAAPAVYADRPKVKAHQWKRWHLGKHRVPSDRHHCCSMRHCWAHNCWGHTDDHDRVGHEHVVTGTVGNAPQMRHAATGSTSNVLTSARDPPPRTNFSELRPQANSVYATFAIRRRSLEILGPCVVSGAYRPYAR